MTGRDEDPKEIARRIVRGVLLEWSFDHPDQDTRRWAYKQWLRGSAEWISPAEWWAPDAARWVFPELDRRKAER
jgi:hypothetical protein